MAANKVTFMARRASPTERSMAEVAIPRPRNGSEIDVIRRNSTASRKVSPAAPSNAAICGASRAVIKPSPMVIKNHPYQA